MLLSTFKISQRNFMMLLQIVLKIVFIFESFAVSPLLGQTFVEFGPYQYYIERNNSVKSYFQAESRCGNMSGATLVMIKTKEVNDFLIEKIGNFSGKLIASISSI